MWNLSGSADTSLAVDFCYTVLILVPRLIDLFFFFRLVIGSVLNAQLQNQDMLGGVKLIIVWEE